MRVEPYQSICEREAEKLGARPEVHPDDLIFQYNLNHPMFQSKVDEAIAYYFQNGFQSAQILSDLLMKICGFDGKQKIELLEFASGYGCVTRHIKNVIPFAETTACDIHSQATKFIEEKFQTKTVLSASRPEDLLLEQKFDAVFALSFFSHMPKASFSRWLRQLASFLKPGGYLVFTTHGMVSAKFFPDCRFDADGFYFKPESEQTDLDSAEYGSACTMPSYVLGQIFKERNWALTFFHEGHWWGHQDVYVVRVGSKG